jgi:3',5'-cyclic AMP phosphodiesterase CpdA
MRIWHLSDLHYRTTQVDNSWADLAVDLAASGRERDDVVVVTGDVTDDGKDAQYQHAERAFGRVPRDRLVICPGNHDYGRWGNMYDPAAAQRWRTFADGCGCVTAPMALWDGTKPVGSVLVLDTCLRTGTPIDFAQGLVGWLARTRVRRWAAACRRQRVASVLALHHNPYYTDWFCRLRDAREFFGVILGNVDVVLMGHEHKVRHTWFPSHLPEALATTHIWAAGCAGKGDAAVGPILELRADVRTADGRVAVVPLGAGIATTREATKGIYHGGGGQ